MKKKLMTGSKLITVLCQYLIEQLLNFKQFKNNANQDEHSNAKKKKEQKHNFLKVFAKIILNKY